jgi:hypothetical protein
MNCFCIATRMMIMIRRLTKSREFIAWLRRGNSGT